MWAAVVTQEGKTACKSRYLTFWLDNDTKSHFQSDYKDTCGPKRLRLYKYKTRQAKSSKLGHAPGSRRKTSQIPQVATGNM